MRNVPSLPERPPAREACPAPEQTLAGTPSRRQSIINALLETDRAIDDIGAEHGRSHRQVGRIAKEAGIDLVERRTIWRDRREAVREVFRFKFRMDGVAAQAAKWARVIELRKAGLSQPLIAERQGIPVSTVNYILCQSGMRTQSFRARSK